jgi:apolipoprotein N-acyltransferase
MAARLPVFAAMLLGVATVLGFAPFGLSLLPVLTLAGLFFLWRRAPTPRAAAGLGFAFGLGLFGAGASWVYVALAQFGGMKGVLAALATAAFCAYLALFPALTGWATARLTRVDAAARLPVAAACWTIAEWLRSWVFSGFPYLTVGYAQTHAWLGAYAALGGVFLVSFAVAGAAAMVAYATQAFRRSRRAAGTAVAGLLALWVAAVGAGRIEWSHATGDPIVVSLVQGNIPEDVKFEATYREETLSIYADLVAQTKGRLIVLPESALPMFADEVPVAYVAQLRAAAQQRNGDLLVGLFFFEPRAEGEDEDHYFNSVVSLGTATTQVYRKRHLVPFGETIPAKPIVGWFIRSVLHIPLADQTPGSADQAPFEVAGQRVAVDICYEDAFGGELIHELPEATLLVNVTNDAWYGHSLAAEQHDEIAAMRAIETARPMLRATNNGITSIIDHRGVELARLPAFTRGVLEGTIAGRAGTTPYVRYGDMLAVVFALAIAGASLAIGKRTPKDSPQPMA